MLRSIERKSLPIIMAILTIGNGIVFAIFLFLNPWGYALFGWSMPLLFLAATIMLFINRNIEDRWLAFGYFGLSAIIGLSLIPVSLVFMGWISSLQHDVLVGGGCPQAVSKDVCSPTSEMISQTNSVWLAPVFLIVGWFVPSLLFLILGFSLRIS